MDLSQENSRSTVWFQLGPVATVVLTAAFIALIWSNWMLLDRTRSLNDALGRRTASVGPQVGEVLPPLAGVDLAGHPIRVDYESEERATLLFTFSPKCGLCDSNWPYWESIARQVDDTRYRVLYVNTSSELDPEYLETHFFHPESTVLAGVDPQTLSDYGLLATPILTVIDPKGVVKKTWLGVTEFEDLDGMEALLSVTLSDAALAADQ